MNLLPFSDHRDRLRLIELLRKSQVLKSRTAPLLVCHHPQLPVTADAEIEAARSERRPIDHLRVERSPEGWLLLKLQREQEPHLVWCREVEAPETLETIYRLDDDTHTPTREWTKARYGTGCKVVYEYEMES